MGYVAVRGGASAIQNAEALVAAYRRGGSSVPLQVQQIREQMRLAVDRVMAEGSLYDPTVGALAIKQAEGDLAEAAFLVRAFRSTLARVGVTPALRTRSMRLIRRISAAFKDVPGGQVLGPTRDYTQRLLDFSLLAADPAPDDLPRVSLPAAASYEAEKVTAYLRRERLLAEPSPMADPPVDITRDPVAFPMPRSARLQTLARGEEGGMLALAYSSMRGFGAVHPTVAELRVGYLPVRLPFPGVDEPVTIGEVLATEVELIGRYGRQAAPGGDLPRFSLGYGFAFGQNERRAIAMAVLDRALMAPEAPAPAPAEDQEFVLQHINGIEAQGFCGHYKLPHYVDFQSELDRLRSMRAAASARRDPLGRMSSPGGDEGLEREAEGEGSSAGAGNGAGGRPAEAREETLG